MGFSSFPAFTGVSFRVLHILFTGTSFHPRTRRPRIFCSSFPFSSPYIRHSQPPHPRPPPRVPLWTTPLPSLDYCISTLYTPQTPFLFSAYLRVQYTSHVIYSTLILAYIHWLPAIMPSGLWEIRDAMSRVVVQRVGPASCSQTATLVELIPVSPSRFYRVEARLAGVGALGLEIM